jgi:pantoate--beta-alanine ligase
MKIIKKISECRNLIEEIKKKDLTIGLVPTMGYLHEGHISLVRAAKSQCQKVFMSIFVNPTQFGPGEDLEKYPRDLERDAALAQDNGVDYIFNPEAGEMYKKDHKTFVQVEKLPDMMCGAHRPGHFRGVTTVVIKLFNIMPAHKAYFGMKDFQQLAIIKKMVKDLDINIEIIECPTVREADGLALSSRNKYLAKDERKNAPIIYRVLKTAEKKILSGEKQAEKIKKEALKELNSNTFIKNIDYFDIRDADTLQEIQEIGQAGEIVIATAATIGKTRLIDNVVINIKK